MSNENILEYLCCPVSKQPLNVADSDLCTQLRKKQTEGQLYRKNGRLVEPEIQSGLVTKDKQTFYPIIDGIPQLLAPEGISISQEPQSQISIENLQYREPYEEMESYDEISGSHLESGEADSALGEISRVDIWTTDEYRHSFPEPASLWLDAKRSVLAQEEAYRYLKPIDGKRILQIGGHGSHLIKFMLAGADEGWLLSPMLGELQRARYLSRKFSLQDRLYTIQGIAEEVPFQNDCMDRIYSGGCLHHTQIDIVAPEILRILINDGKASFVDPVMTLPYRLFVRPFYSRGIGRVDNAQCTPISQNLLNNFTQDFTNSSCIYSRTFVHFPLIMTTSNSLAL